LVYSNALSGSFLLDDVETIVNNADIWNTTSSDELCFYESWWKLFNTSGEAHRNRLFQPLTYLSFRFNYYTNALNPTGYHITNVALHVIASLLVYLVGKILFKGKRCLAAVCAALFSLHPIHTEAVDHLASRSEVLCAVFCLLSFLTYHKAVYDTSSGLKMLFLSLLYSVLAFLSKGVGITVLFLNAIWDLHHHSSLSSDIEKQYYNRKNIMLRFGTLAALCALMFNFIPLTFEQNAVTAFENPLAANLGSSTYWLSVLYSHFRYTKLLFVPTLSFDYSSDCVSLVDSFDDPRNLWTLLTYLCLISLIAWSFKGNGKTPMLISLSFFILPLLPYSQIFFLSATFISERNLYIPSAGFCFAVTYLLHCGSEKIYSRKTFGWICLIILFFSATTSYKHNPTWDNPIALSKNGLESCPNSTKALKMLASELEKLGQFSEAEEHYFQVLSLNPVDITSLGRLGKRALLRGDYTEALSKYKQIINQNPKPYHQFAYLDVGYIHWKYGLKQKALEFFKYAASLYRNPEYSAQHDPHYLGQAENFIGCLLMEEGFLEQSQDFFKQALGHQPQDCGYNNNLGIALHKLNRSLEAEEIMKTTLDLNQKREGDRNCLLLRSNKESISWFLTRQPVAPISLTPHVQIIA